MRTLKILLAFALCLGFLVLSPENSFAAQAQKAASKTDSIKWTIKVKPLSGTVDLYLTDENSGKGVRNAKVKAVITLPNGEKLEKEMMKMTMKQKINGKVIKKGIYYMFSLDMSAQGAYIFDIAVKAGKRDIQINAKYDVK